MVRDKGIMSVKEVNEANIPVVCFLTGPGELDNDSDRWKWVASNFMPRKERCEDGMYYLTADTREEILDIIRKYVVPLYEAALENLQKHGSNYYWERRPENG